MASFFMYSLHICKLVIHSWMIAIFELTDLISVFDVIHLFVYSFICHLLCQKVVIPSRDQFSPFLSTSAFIFSKPPFLVQFLYRQSSSESPIFTIMYMINTVITGSSKIMLYRCTCFISVHFNTSRWKFCHQMHIFVSLGFSHWVSVQRPTFTCVFLYFVSRWTRAWVVHCSSSTVYSTTKRLYFCSFGLWRGRESSTCATKLTWHHCCRQRFRTAWSTTPSMYYSPHSWCYWSVIRPWRPRPEGWLPSKGQCEAVRPFAIWPQ